MKKIDVFDPERFRDIALEESVAGAVLKNPDLYFTVFDILSLDDFSEKTIVKIFEAVNELFTEKGEFTYIDVADRLSGKVEKEYILRLLKSACDEDFLVSVCQRLKRLAELRRIQEMLLSAMNLLDREELSTSRLSELVQRLIEQNTRIESLPVAKLLAQHIEEITKEESLPAPTIQTGYRELDECTGGLSKGAYVVVGARPSVGKTSFALNLALNLREHGERVKVLFVSLEMSTKDILDRLVSMLSGVSLSKVRLREFSEEEKERVREAMKKCAELETFFLLDSSDMTVEDLRIQVFKHKEKYGITTVIVDYLQLFRTRKRIEKEYDRVTYISRELKSITKQFDVTVIALAQLSRESEKRTDKVPVLADLRSSGQIEQDADIVMLLHDPAKYKKEPTDEDLKTLEVYIAKNRQGKTGKVVLYYDRETQLIRNFEELKKVQKRKGGRKDEKDEEVEYTDLDF